MDFEQFPLAQHWGPWGATRAPESTLFLETVFPKTRQHSLWDSASPSCLRES